MTRARDPIAEGRAIAETWYGERGAGFHNANCLNAYVCAGGRGRPGCGSYIVTVDRDPGVTPFIIRCGNCGGDAHSKFYRVGALFPTHEWYRPKSAAKLTRPEREHVRNGGLLLRPIGRGEDVWQRQDNMAGHA